MGRRIEQKNKREGRRKRKEKREINKEEDGKYRNGFMTLCACNRKKKDKTNKNVQKEKGKLKVNTF
jgi:hypothetical protein